MVVKVQLRGLLMAGGAPPGDRLLWVDPMYWRAMMKAFREASLKPPSVRPGLVGVGTPRVSKGKVRVTVDEGWGRYD